MAETNNYRWPFPDEDTDPHYDPLAEFFQRIDASVYALNAVAAGVLIPADNIAFSSVTNKLTWDGSFQIPIIGSGFYLTITYGPDGVSREVTLDEGDRVVVTVPITSNSAQTGIFTTLNGAITATDGLFTLGIRKNNKFHANLPTSLG